MTGDPDIKVTPWELLMAVRYGMGRMTYANDDAARLARRYWRSFNASERYTIRRDAARVTGAEAAAWAWLGETE